MDNKFVYLVRETSKHYTFQAWENLQEAWKQAEALNETSKNLKHRSRYYVEAVQMKDWGAN